MKKLLLTIVLILSFISVKSETSNDTLKVDTIRHSRNIGQSNKVIYEDLTGRKICGTPCPGIYIQISSYGRKLIKIN